MFVRSSSVFPLLFRDVIFKIPVAEPTLYLTFDDGPDPDVTPRVLDLLKKHGAKATFFLCGKHVENNRQLVQQIKAEDHAIGNHGSCHLNGWKTTTHNYLADVAKAEDLIQSPLFRPPYGKLKLRQYMRLRKNYQIVLWDVMCMDFDRNISPETCFSNIRKYAASGSVIVLHDSEKAATNMLYALEQTLVTFGKEGYRFVSIK